VSITHLRTTLATGDSGTLKDRLRSCSWARCPWNWPRSPRQPPRSNGEGPRGLLCSVIWLMLRRRSPPPPALWPPAWLGWLPLRLGQLRKTGAGVPCMPVLPLTPGVPWLASLPPTACGCAACDPDGAGAAGSDSAVPAITGQIAS
jgi:hypothetical protein